MHSLKGRMGITILVSTMALILMLAINKPANAAQIGPGAFNNPTIIDFEDAPNALILHYASREKL